MSPTPVMTPARDAQMLDIEPWRTVTESATTGRHEPLRPARDPVNAGVTVRVEWAGRCRVCALVIWAAVQPGKTVPRLCPECRAAELAAGRPVGAPLFRPWMIWRTPPPAVPGTSRKRGARREIAGCKESTLPDPLPTRESDMGFDDAATAPTPRRGLRRGGRPRIHVSAAVRGRAAARAYRARQRQDDTLP